eukprot:2447471-Heterocapsa_arctica.AAC.1
MFTTYKANKDDINNQQTEHAQEESTCPREGYAPCMPRCTSGGGRPNCHRQQPGCGMHLTHIHTHARSHGSCRGLRCQGRLRLSPQRSRGSPGR